MRNPLSLDAFIDWLEKQPAEKEYDWWDYRKCLFLQYARFLGGDGCTLLRHFVYSKLCPIARETPWTFGAALERAKAFRESSR